jgi:hypothetical protein
MADRGQRCLAVAAVAAAVLVLPAGASADLMPWLAGAAPIAAPAHVAAAGETVRARKTCRRVSRKSHTRRCRVRDPRLGSRGLDRGLQAPVALDF